MSLPKWTFALTILWSVFATHPLAFAVDAPIAPDDISEASMRINAYFANIPEHQPPCEDIPLLYDRTLGEGIPESQRFEFQSIRRGDGLFAKQQAVIKEARQNLRQVNETWLFEALDYFSQIRAYEEEKEQMSEAAKREANLHHENASLQVMHTYASHLYASYTLYVEEEKLRAIGRGYYNTVTKGSNKKDLTIGVVLERAQKDPNYLNNLKKETAQMQPAPFDGASWQTQARMIDAFHKRLACLRDERIRVFTRLSQNTIALEKSLVAYIEATRNDKLLPDETNVVDEINAQLERAALQQTYLWLLDEFALQTSVYKQMLLSHELKLKNARLFPLLEDQQRKHPAIGPTRKLPEDSTLERARQDLARVRARFGYLVLLEAEAKLEGASLANASYVRHFKESVGGEFKKYFGGLSSIGKWLWNKENETELKKEAITVGQTIAKFGGLTLQLGLGTLDTVLSSPLKGMMIQGSRYAGIEGWRSTAERNYETYQKAAGQFSPRIKLMERFVRSLDNTEARRYIAHLKTGAKARKLGGKEPTVMGTNPFADLLGDATFNASCRGGIPWILEPFAADPTDHAALWLESSRHAFYGSMQAARDRIAAARGIEIKNPDEAVSSLDIHVGASAVVNDTGDILFKVPAIVKNMLGERFGSVYQDQFEFMQSMEKQLAEIDLVIGDLRRPNINYDPEALSRFAPETYPIYKYLSLRNYEFAQADYNLVQNQWQRIKRYNTTLESGKGGKRLTPSGELLISAIHREEDQRLSKLEVHLAYLKLIYMTQTANYKAAVMQVQSMQNMENKRLKNLRINKKVEFNALRAELESLAVANQSITAWESLLNQALVSIVVSPFSTSMNQRIFSRGNGTLWEAAVAGSKRLGGELDKTFFPWSKVVAENGLTNVIKGAAWDVSRARAAEATSDLLKASGDLWNARGINFVNSWVGETIGHPELADSARFENHFIHPDDAETMLNELFDIGWDLGAHYANDRANAFARVSVNWWAGKKQFEMLLRKAEEERYKMREALGQETDSTLKRMTDEEFVNLSAEQRRVLYQEMEDAANKPITSDAVETSLALYRSAFQQLQTEHFAMKQRLRSLASTVSYLSVLSSVRDAALDQIKNTRSIADVRKSEIATPAQALAAAELRTRLLFRAHRLDELEILVSKDPNLNHDLPNQVLRRGADVDLIRGALRSSMAEAEALGDDTAKSRIRQVALDVDQIRINKIDTLIQEFMNKPGMAGKVVQIIQGGAAEGNPEYRGIFGDIDFTLMLQKGAIEESEQIKTALMDFFEENGYPLARSSESPSSMDSEGFVQPFDAFDSSQATLKEIIEDVVEKSKDPTRFYTEAGSVWFINNAAYSGKVLWSNGKKQLEFIKASRRAGDGLATDMSRYLGFVASKKYTHDYLKDKKTKRWDSLETALDKGKYFLRLIDSYQMAHPIGNGLYNDRAEKKRKAQESGRELSGKDASYHWQIVENAEKIIDYHKANPGKPGALFDDNDREYIEIVGKLKLKGEYDSPWKAIMDGKPNMTKNQAMDKAQETIDWMRRKTPEILAYNSHVWYQQFEKDAVNPDPKIRAKAAATVYRKISTIKVMMERDDGSSMPFAISKLKDGKIMSEEAHRDEIKRLMGLAEKGEPVADGVADIIAKRQPNPELDEMTRKELDKYLQEAALNRQVSPEELEVFAQEKHMKNWAAYFVTLSSKIEAF